MLEISGLTKRFGRLTVIDNFGLTVPINGFTVLIGPSGCGKTTLFNILMGVVPRDAGSVRWQGNTISDLCGLAAYMQQKDLLLPWLTLLDNSLLPVRLGTGHAARAAVAARTHFGRLGLDGFENYLPHQVSGGMRQRCALVRTLMFEHALVLLDEPLSALDAITRRSLQALLLLLQSDFDKSVLMITHDIEEALLLADDLLVLTPSPMRIREQFRLSQPKPRRVADPELIRIKAHVLEILQRDMRLETP